ncbi:hypothetical protein P154DRAFT_572711 [Amniculicola lignicola CBS 123094]|uniref:Uncharacterized protein n=1 Tax=Amniculicola lignicola CBS 123094 TaxID=1392246 RepID=A0A6A5X1A9_9PLEO|nr:hypothetical protein P154DRAFT_572711 [Amniculicola lignicola CBS 123094]
MGSNASREVAATNATQAVAKKRNWTSIVVSSIFGGTIAVVAAPTIAALAPVGAVGFIIATTTTGVLGSIVMKQFYRRTVIQYIGTSLNGVICSLRDNKGLLDSTGRAVIEGALFGVAGGALAWVAPALAGAHTVPIVPGKVNIILGIGSTMGVAALVKNLVFLLMELDCATLFVEFATEAQHYVNCLVRCAIENGVGLEIVMRIGSTTDMTARVNLAGAIGAQHCQFYWSVNEEVNLH